MATTLMAQKNSSMKLIKLLLLVFVFNLSQAQQDLSYILADMQRGWSIGNGCGQFGNNGYKVCKTDALELNGDVLEVMWVELTVHQPITNYGVETDVLELLANGQIILKCEISSDYQNESTIIVLDQTLGNIDSHSMPLRVYPNPAKNHVFIEAHNLKQIACYDTNGRLLFSIKNPTTLNKVYLFNYSDGLYHLVLKDLLGGIENRKLIVKR